MRSPARSGNVPVAKAASDALPPTVAATNVRTPKTTETGLTPTTQTHVPSSNDPPTRKKDPEPQIGSTVNPLGATMDGGPDDDAPTGTREIGQQRGVNQTLVMEETRDGASPASARQLEPPHSQSPRAQIAREMAVAPTMVANKNAPTAAEVEAEALRSLKATTRMAPEDAAASQAALSQQLAARSGTMRINPQDPYPGPAQRPAQTQPIGQHAAQALVPGSGAIGWNESTVLRRRPAGDQGPGMPGKAGIVGELESLPGTTGFLIGIGLGLGIAAGVVIALLLMR